jgi:hypothetical protein
MKAHQQYINTQNKKMKFIKIKKKTMQENTTNNAKRKTKNNDLKQE